MVDDDAEREEDAGIWDRSTAPQSEFTTAQVGTGVAVLATGLVVTIVVPHLLA